MLRPKNVAQVTWALSLSLMRHIMCFGVLSWNPATIRTSLEDETPCAREPSCPGKAISDQFLGSPTIRTESSQDQQSSDQPVSDRSHPSGPSQEQQARLDLVDHTELWGIKNAFSLVFSMKFRCGLLYTNSWSSHFQHLYNSGRERKSPFLWKKIFILGNWDHFFPR